MTPLLVFLSILIVAASTMAGYSYLNHSKVRNWRDWKKAILVVLVLSSTLAFISSKTHAELFEYTDIYFGLEYPNSEGHPACVVGDNQITSNIGINQNIFVLEEGQSQLFIDGTYRHHSCAIGDDDRVSDTLGLNATFRINW